MQLVTGLLPYTTDLRALYSLLFWCPRGPEGGHDIDNILLPPPNLQIQEHAPEYNGSIFFSCQNIKCYLWCYRIEDFANTLVFTQPSLPRCATYFNKKGSHPILSEYGNFISKVCPRNIAQFNSPSYHIKIDNTSWTYCMIKNERG